MAPGFMDGNMEFPSAIMKSRINNFTNKATKNAPIIALPAVLLPWVLPNAVTLKMKLIEPFSKQKF